MPQHQPSQNGIRGTSGSSSGSAYENACVEAGLQVHPDLLIDFSRSVPANSVILDIGLARRQAAGVGQPIQDSDIVAVCLALRSLCKTNSRSVRLDFTGESSITCAGARTIAAFLQVDCGIQHVVLRGTSVGAEGAAALGASLDGKSPMEMLDLGQCCITDKGMRLFARGLQAQQAGPPSRLTTLLLDRNPLSDEGVLELIMLLEGPFRPPSLRRLCVQPVAPPAHVSLEADAALQVVCGRFQVELGAVSAVMPRPSQSGCVASTTKSPLLPRNSNDSPAPSNVRPCSSSAYGGCREAENSLASLAPVGASQLPPREQSHQPSGRSAKSNGHLASWMTSTERELKELKWLLSASVARLDGQHMNLMNELGDVKRQLDAWDNEQQAIASSSKQEEAAYTALEARFTALEQLVGSERSECSQMRQLVEAVTSGEASSTDQAGVANGRRSSEGVHGNGRSYSFSPNR